MFTIIRFNSFRCEDFLQYRKYCNLTAEIYQSNANKIYNITGCLSKCERYHYTIKPKTGVILNEGEGDMSIYLYLPTGETEVMKQVNTSIQPIEIHEMMSK